MGAPQHREDLFLRLIEQQSEVLRQHAADDRRNFDEIKEIARDIVEKQDECNKAISGLHVEMATMKTKDRSRSGVFTYLAGIGGTVLAALLIHLIMKGF